MRIEAECENPEIGQTRRTTSPVDTALVLKRILADADRVEYSLTTGARCGVGFR